jgi:ribosomal protein S15P/S13E
VYEQDGYEDDYEDGYSEYPGYRHRQDAQRFYTGAAGNVLQALTEYARTLEHEKSNRADIERKRTAALSVIRSQRQVMIEYLTRRFGERGKLYEQYFKLVDTALELRNEEIIRLALESILNIYQDNPVAGIEEFRQHMETISEVIRI